MGISFVNVVAKWSDGSTTSHYFSIYLDAASHVPTILRFSDSQFLKNLLIFASHK
jgi:hypothetical protein